MILYNEGGTQLQEDEAKMILEALTFAYPNHPWAVRVYDGGAFIRHLEFPTNWGMNVKFRGSYSASSLKREVILRAGEWLERANLQRGKWDETPIKHVDGVPEKYQPVEYQDEQAQKRFDVVIAAAEEALRTEARPQAVKEAAADGN